MPRTTSFTLGDELEGFIREQVESGAHSSASEVVRHALEYQRDQKRKEAWVRAAIDEGLASGLAEPGVFERVRERHGLPPRSAKQTG